jgi:hypothetical protein
MTGFELAGMRFAEFRNTSRRGNPDEAHGGRCWWCWDSRCEANRHTLQDDPNLCGLVVLRRIDSDRNGHLSRVEARLIVAVASHFDAVDNNGDGLLTGEEYLALQVGQGGRPVLRTEQLTRPAAPCAGSAVIRCTEFPLSELPP